jgi:predicted nucleic acid-binding protein
MIDIVVDSGPLIALFDGSDAYHARAVVFIEGLNARLVTNLPVITEVVYVLDFSPQAQRDFLVWVEQAYANSPKPPSPVSPSH